jgi:hypothetical protein
MSYVRRGLGLAVPTKVVTTAPAVKPAAKVVVKAAPKPVAKAAPKPVPKPVAKPVTAAIVTKQPGAPAVVTKLSPVVIPKLSAPVPAPVFSAPMPTLVKAPLAPLVPLVPVAEPLKALVLAPTAEPKAPIATLTPTKAPIAAPIVTVSLSTPKAAALPTGPISSFAPVAPAPTPKKTEAPVPFDLLAQARAKARTKATSKKTPPKTATGLPGRRVGWRGGAVPPGFARAAAKIGGGAGLFGKIFGTRTPGALSTTTAATRSAYTVAALPTGPIASAPRVAVTPAATPAPSNVAAVVGNQATGPVSSFAPVDASVGAGPYGGGGGGGGGPAPAEREEALEPEEKEAAPAPEAGASAADTIKNLPKWVWIAGGAAALYFFVLRRR